MIAIWLFLTGNFDLCDNERVKILLILNVSRVFWLVNNWRFNLQCVNLKNDYPVTAYNF